MNYSWREYNIESDDICAIRFGRIAQFSCKDIEMGFFANKTNNKIECFIEPNLICAYSYEIFKKLVADVKELKEYIELNYSE